MTVSGESAPRAIAAVTSSELIEAAVVANPRSIALTCNCAGCTV